MLQFLFLFEISVFKFIVLWSFLKRAPKTVQASSPKGLELTLGVRNEEGELDGAVGSEGAFGTL